MKYFASSEFECHCGRLDCDAPDMDPEFLTKLDELRAKWGRPLYVTSGVRCRVWNEEIGGAPKSQHLLGKAADLRTSSRNEAHALHALAEMLGFGGVEIGKGFIHVDIGPKRDWIYL